MKGQSLAILLIVLLGLGCAASRRAAAPAGVEGQWEGEVLLRPGELEFPMFVHFGRGAEGAFQGTISWPHRGLKDVPLKEVQVEGRSVFFVQAEKEGEFVFDGELSEDGREIKGQRAFQGQMNSFVLERPDGNVRRPEVLALSGGEKQWQQLFNRDSGKVRLLALLAPT